MKTFRVIRVGSMWQGKQDGEAATLVTTVDFQQVRTIVFERARELGPSRVLVFDANGEPTEERTFGIPKPKGYAGDWS